MNKIERLNALNKEYQSVLSEKEKIIKLLSEKLFKTMEEYRLVMEWYLEKGFYLDPYGRGSVMQGKFPLAYDDEQGSLYYWEPAAIQINKINLRTNKKSAFNLHLFVSYGFYEEAMKNIKNLDREMVLILEGAKEDKQHLESLVEKYT